MKTKKSLKDLKPRKSPKGGDTSTSTTSNIGSQSSGSGAGKITFNPFSITRK